MPYAPKTLTELLGSDIKPRTALSCLAAQHGFASVHHLQAALVDPATPRYHYSLPGWGDIKQGPAGRANDLNHLSAVLLDYFTSLYGHKAATDKTLYSRAAVAAKSIIGTMQREYDYATMVGIETYLLRPYMTAGLTPPRDRWHQLCADLMTPWDDTMEPTWLREGRRDPQEHSFPWRMIFAWLAKSDRGLYGWCAELLELAGLDEAEHVIMALDANGQPRTFTHEHRDFNQYQIQFTVTDLKRDILDLLYAINSKWKDSQSRGHYRWWDVDVAEDISCGDTAIIDYSATYRGKARVFKKIASNA